MTIACAGNAEDRRGVFARSYYNSNLYSFFEKRVKPTSDDTIDRRDPHRRLYIGRVSRTRPRSSRKNHKSPRPIRKENGLIKSHEICREK